MSLQEDVNTSQPTLRHSINRVLIVLATIFSLRYFYWRAHATMVPVAKWFFYLFLLAELLSFLETVLFYFTAWKFTCHRPRPPLPDRTVDVYIATYNESVGLLRDTVVCSMSMTYPHTTYLLDDGNRTEVRALARELGCEYIARTDRNHAKAGNLNNALKNTKGEFIVTLDADHVPMPDMIENLIGFFADPAVAIVQSCQDFYNQDSFQHVAPRHDSYVWQQQELFFSVIQPGKDAYNAAFYCGSPAMCRRASLEEIGGFATETITEDMHTGLRLQKKGKKVLYYNKTVAWGLAPQTFAGFVTQWRRWGHGAFQVLRCENPLFGKGLSIAQRICYFSSFYFYWMSYQKLVYILTPIFCLVTGIFPLSTQPGSFARYFLPYLVLNLLATANLQGGMIAFVLSEQFNVVKLSALLGSLKGLLHSDSKFAVTPKSRAAGARWSQVWLQLALLSGILAGLVVGLWRIHDAASRFQLWALIVNVCWGLFFIFLTAPIVRKALARAEYRRAYRFPTKLDVPLMVAFTPPGGQHKNTRTDAQSLNRFGLAFRSDSPIALGTKIGINLQLPGHNVYAAGVVVRSRETEFGRKKQVETGIHFEHIDPKDQDAIVKYLFWDVAPRHGRRMQLTYESQNQRPATSLPEIFPSELVPAVVDFAMKGEPVRSSGSK
jgi:cellulose synthase (UDP-forming)